ncbi:MAG: D-alanine--D-alanine ligase [Deltaproteobacteria bacterium]|nr:D-alanine--D-alanine ligase [Deltaproteobacteria bacterium]
MTSKWKNKKVAVLMGGLSKERDISLKSGKAVAQALRSKGYPVIEIDCEQNLPEQLRQQAIDVAFIALHGPWGEDGCVQGLLEWMRIPYTGSGVLASALAMDKAVLNRVSRDLEFLVPKEVILDARLENADDFVSRFREKFPVIVKPSREGSTINVTIVRRQKELKAAIEKALQSDHKILVEEYIEGKEVTVAVLNGKALSSIEIVPKGGFYDYQAKYTKGMTEYILPARLSPRCIEKLNQISTRVYQMIDCSGVIRVDFIVNTEEKPFFLEVNTIPGFTETSLVPKAAKEAGISFEDLCETILEGAGLKIRTTNYGPRTTDQGAGTGEKRQ